MLLIENKKERKKERKKEGKHGRDWGTAFLAQHSVGQMSIGQMVLDK